MTTAELMTSDEAAKYLGVSPNTLANWRCHKLYGPDFVKVGQRGYIRYKKADLDQFVEKNTERVA